MRRWVVCLVTLGTLAAGAVVAPTADAHVRTSTVVVDGAVAAPTSYTVAQLATLPLTTAVDTRSRHPHTVTGVDLEALITSSAPVLPDAKNAQLRVSVTVSGRRGAVAIALGELDPGFGNHPALLALTSDGRAIRGGPELIFPGDRGDARAVLGVHHIRVAVAAPATPTDLPAGSVQVISGSRTRVLSAARLAALPTVTMTVSFLAGTTTQTHVETGPTLAAVLRAARIRITSTTSVAAVGSDSYIATVTPGEAHSGGRPLLISTVEDGIALTQPRLVAVGDVKGGRDVSDVVALAVSNGCPTR